MDDDGRPILFKRNHGAPNLTCVIGGKIDNVFDVFDAVDLACESEPVHGP